MFQIDRERGVHESIDEAEEEEDEDSIPEIVNEEYKLVEIVKPLVRVFYFHFFPNLKLIWWRIFIS